jgi:hypothetical protein
MATQLSAIVTQARTHLIEPVASFWSDSELLGHARLGIADLWKALIDTYADHFLSENESVTQVADSGTLSGVPTDCFRIRAIEPLDGTSNQGLVYLPLDYTHPDFRAARASPAQEASGRTIFYDIVGAGPAVSTLSIRVAPVLTSTVTLRLIYIATIDIGALAVGSNNPIPGESDNAVMAWIIAYARAKEREDRAPDAEWLGVYATEKQALLRAVTPRQEDEVECAEAMFEAWWG